VAAAFVGELAYQPEGQCDIQWEHLNIKRTRRLGEDTKCRISNPPVISSTRPVYYTVMLWRALRRSRNIRLPGTTHHHSNVEALDRWMISSKQLANAIVLSDVFHFEHLSDLYITLPTRDGTRKPYQPPIVSSPLGYGHHLVFFHQRVPESQLREDGTEDTFCPPQPFTRRMWAGGKITWHNDNPLIIGQKATAASSLATIERKELQAPSKTPMIFVNQKIDFTMDGGKYPSVVEERTHVYLADVTKGVRVGVLFQFYAYFSS